MTWHQLKQNGKAHFHAILIDRFLPKSARSVLRKCAIFGGAFFFLTSFGALPLDFSYADGAFFLCVFIYLSFSFLESFYRSMKDSGLYSRVHERILEEDPVIEYALSNLIYKTDEIDATRALCETAVGIEVFGRAGITAEECKQFIFGNRTPIIASTLQLAETGLSLGWFVGGLYDADKAL